MRYWAMSVSAACAVLLVRSAHSEDLFSRHAEELRNVTLQFLHLHAVPCGSVTKVESVLGMEEIATCEDGREWALFWLENEVAFVHPRTSELYRWQADVYKSQPQRYGGLKASFRASKGDGS